MISSVVTVATDLEGEMKFKVGYVFTDEMDNFSVNQETFNTYEGFALSIMDIQIATVTGFNFYGDLKNVTLNNRNLNFTASKVGLLNLSFYNNQYRRIYNESGSQYTRRESTGINGEFTPYEYLKFFGGFYYYDKDGSQLSVYRPVYDSVEYTTDYTQYSWNLGTTIKYNESFITGEYRSVIFQDDTDFSLDREAEQFNLNIFSFLPTKRKIAVSAGFLYRKDYMNERVQKLRTITGWGGAKAYFKDGIKFDYRFVASQADHNDEIEGTHIYHHTAALSKNWIGQGGLRLGYDYRTYNYSEDRAVSNGILFNGWYKKNNWTFKGNYSSINKEDDKGRTHIGDQKRTKHSISIGYNDKNWGGLKGKIEKQIKEYDDLNAEANYTSSSIKLVYKYEKLGKIVASYSYVLGEFENRHSELDFEFADKLVNLYLYPNSYDKFDVAAGATYYHSERDNDVEKFNLNIKVSYEFMDGHMVSCKYKTYTYDDLLVASNTYTANIIEVNLIKKLNF
jgi:hypothetical protein